MFYDPIRNAYIDAEDGTVVLQETASHRPQHSAFRSLSSGSNGSTRLPGQKSGKYQIPDKSRDVEIDLEMVNVMDLDPSAVRSQLLELNRLEKLNKSKSERDHSINMPTIAMAPRSSSVNESISTSSDSNHTDPAFKEVSEHIPTNENEDWIFARALQAMEFEISNEMMMVEGYEEGGDFNEKEYRASRSCKSQLMTISAFICVIQIGVMIATIQMGGYAPRSENPMIGPPATTLVRFGAKEAALIVDEAQWWRLVSPIMVHAGILHILPNVAIQLRVGGYLNLVYGSWKWFWIYLVSGVFGEMMSCLFIPGSVGVGSSGALMGMLSSWIVWIVFRWKKIPPQCKRQRNCQLGIVAASIVITLGTSFSPNVDWGAHFGGAVQGVLWGIILLGSELDNFRNKVLVRVAAVSVSAVLFGYSLYYMVARLNPPTSSLDYWRDNDWN
mmetsp:Transcript_17383/g.23904  ORF Transcript_17383/g.23904 Transcript_17383/m.23904 type:complete len:443 (-) Transcript_17383:753-2081(-)